MKRINTMIITALFFGFVNSSIAADLEDGEKLFKMNCSSCHKATTKFIGPALKGAVAKYNDDEYLYNFIRDSQALITAGDERAVAIFNEHGKQVMTPFPNLTDDDITNILAYVDSLEGEETSGGTIKIRKFVAPPPKPYRPLYLKSNFGLWVLISIVIIMLVASLFAITKAMSLADSEDDF